MRGWPMSMTSTTEARPAMAPTLMKYVSHLRPGPAALMATNTGWGTFSVV